MNTVSKIKLDDVVYDIQDTGVRQLVAAMQSDIADISARLSSVEEALAGPVIPELGDAAWNQINEAAASGDAQSHWNIGDEIDVELTTGEIITFQIYGFDHDDLTGGGKAAVTFGMKNSMSNIRVLNSYDDNFMGYHGTGIHTWLNGDLFSLLPPDLQAVIKSVDKKTSAGSQSATINTNSMNIFLFSEVECCGSFGNSYSGEGTQYPVFTDNASRIKKLQNGNGPANTWWLRSPCNNWSWSFCAVDNNGASRGVSADYSYGVCFGFCV